MFGVHSFFFTVQLLPHRSLMYIHTPPPVCLPESLFLSILIREKPSILTHPSSISSRSQVSVKHITDDSRYSWINRVQAASSSVLLLMERRLPIMIEGRGTRLHLLLKRRRTPPRLPRFRGLMSAGISAAQLWLFTSRSLSRSCRL